MGLDLIPIDQRQAGMPTQEAEFDVRAYIDVLRLSLIHI